jgi:hypothetical protein
MLEKTRTARDPFRCSVPDTLPGTYQPVVIGVVTDRLFSLILPGNLRYNFALELDRATTDIRSKMLVGKSSLRRKLIGYFHA